ncbi:MAG TPA: hypothetical protein VFB62_02540, partial [Polyangiaceae bacterium]|nr:hypothetical protein [Polyangiaceae bacterium]
TIPKEPRSRAWLYLLGGAAAVALAWVATQSLRTEEPTEASPVSEPSPPPTAIAEPPASASAAPSASAVASTETPPMTKTPWRPRPPPPAKATVDPKFGLPQ